MKAKRDHRIPIVQPILDLIMHNESKSGLVFPSRNNTAVSDMTLSAVMKRMHQADDRGFLDLIIKDLQFHTESDLHLEIGLPKLGSLERLQNYNLHINSAAKLSMLIIERTC